MAAGITLLSFCRTHLIAWILHGYEIQAVFPTIDPQNGLKIG
jgi:hypothetical protein